MQENKMLNYIKNVLENMPKDWLNLTTHRLDIYNEELAKTDFLNQFEELFKENNSEISALTNLPTAYDYIRLGHPLSCVLEWAIANLNNTKAENVISFSSKTIPILAILRTNLLENKKTQILYTDEIASFFDAKIIREIYGYNFEMQKIEAINSVPKFDGSTIFISSTKNIFSFDDQKAIDFFINLNKDLGSILFINGKENEQYISDIQHVRRRETIAMTPSNSLLALQSLVNHNAIDTPKIDVLNNKKIVLESIKEITGTTINPLVASSGLSIQYAIMMGLIHDAQENYPEKAIKFIVPPNCYGGTNDQARRVAACLKNVEIVDLPVDGNNDMVQSIETVLTKIATEDAVPFIIAEIPTNPRVEVPNLIDLKNVLSKKRITKNGKNAIEPVFILDQTFCPNVHFLGEGEILSEVKTISYASGSKFPSGGKCTAGYCVGNDKTTRLMEKIAIHLQLCDNEATHHQMEILAEQLPSMNQRIADAYKNTREFVTFIQEKLPEAKINFVSEELANQSFTPSVFSLDLPTKGNTDAERETYKRALNLKLINLMITQIPNESKFCVSYGQLKGCYWTIPATSTQGTTKEGDKDYIVRTSVSGNLDLELHKQVFLEFVNSI
ncbi:cystathionine beta-synthase [Polaribacter vadi]|uniref:Cystathionine beta-synthase n=1 Tax=Polaribacter vadi TaxID=1774273 RepID=A0A1B8TU16_9FLAO|nr:PLP-dependent transferase [Polaribacter vadi]AOW18286.1 cystathionine beta-synthase [Polaribacter vadi]OBY63019.1 cystathionine beta-synthase [Polaribacter vadi]